MINMRMVTTRIDAYTLTEHCLRLAKGVIEQEKFMFTQDEGGIHKTKMVVDDDDDSWD